MAIRARTARGGWLRTLSGQHRTGLISAPPRSRSRRADSPVRPAEVDPRNRVSGEQPVRDPRNDPVRMRTAPSRFLLPTPDGREAGVSDASGPSSR